MDAKPLPARPSLEQYKKQAKDLAKAYKSRGPKSREPKPLDPESHHQDAIRRMREFHPHADKFLSSETLKAKFTLADAQLIVAREHGFESWTKFAKQIEKLAANNPSEGINNPVEVFLKAATVPRDSSHDSGTLAGAEAIRAAYPEVAASNIYTACVLGDDVAVRNFLKQDTQSATTKGGPHHWDALTYLCFSRYLRGDQNQDQGAVQNMKSTRSGGFVRAAEALLAAGANANTGFYEKNPPHEDEFETVLYGAAGFAHHAGVTRLLLAHGADPNNNEVYYHSPETYDNAALKVLVESGKLNQDSLAAMLLRKHDWHDYDGVKYLLEHGADPNRMTQWQRTATHQAALRDNSLEMFNALLDHGADPTLPTHGRSAVSIAARRGRRDLLQLFAERGVSIELQGADRLIAACAMNNADAIRSITASDPQLVNEVIAGGGKLLAEFSGVGNTDGVRNLLDLGIDVAARSRDGDGFWDITRECTALHVAAWRARHATVKFLVSRGAPVNAEDAKGSTPLALAVRACVDSYWTDRRTPESVQALLDAGASVAGVDYPSGYAEVDELLRQHEQGL